MGVCKTWKQAIVNSKRLQKDLFFLADGEPQPLHKIEWYDANSEDSITAITNALLKGFIGAVLIGKGSLEGSGGICVSTYISGANPSWAHMLLKQPPISNFTTILNFYKYATPISFRQQSGNVESRGGIRLGDFLKILKKLHGHDRWTFQGFQTDRSDLLAFDFVISDEKEYERVADGRIGGLFPAMTTYCYW